MGDPVGVAVADRDTPDGRLRGPPPVSGTPASDDAYMDDSW